jgi:hypothetical protein
MYRTSFTTNELSPIRHFTVPIPLIDTLINHLPEKHIHQQESVKQKTHVPETNEK